MTNFKGKEETTTTPVTEVDLTEDFEYHDLRSTKDCKDCWISINHLESLGMSIVRYHYTSLKEDNYGCYLIEYV